MRRMNVIFAGIAAVPCLIAGRQLSAHSVGRHYITLIMRVRFRAVMMGASLGLAACTGVPIAKTNCWATAGSTVTTSTKGASPDDRLC